MTASTARIIGGSLLSTGRRRARRCRARRPSLPAGGGGGLGLDHHVGVLELGAAAGAQRLVGLDDLPAAGARAAQLVALDAVQERADQPRERQQRRDREPEEERGPLDL